MKSEHQPGDGGREARIGTQRGETRDKIPGFDPAAAPLETDQEAGGTPSVSTGDLRPRGSGERPPETAFATAMRPFDGAPAPPAPSGGVVIYGLVIACIAAVLLCIVWTLTGSGP